MLITPSQDAKAPLAQELMPWPGHLLADRSERQGAEPWLFFRRTLQWRWRSYGQVADQVRRGMATWSLAAESAQETPGAHLYGTQHPDTLALLLTVLGRGGRVFLHPHPADTGDAVAHELSSAGGSGRQGTSQLWLQVAAEGESSGLAEFADRGPRRLIMPAAVGHLESRPLELLRDEDLIGQEMAELVEMPPAEMPPAEMPPAEIPPEGRTADGSVQHRAPRHVAMTRLRARTASLARQIDTCRGPKGQRPILCVSPSVPPRDLWCIAWATLLSDAAWVLEPQADAYAATATWVRPSLLLASPTEEAALHRGLVATPKRHRRLRRVLIMPQLGGSAGEGDGQAPAIDPQLWAELGVERRVLPPTGGQVATDHRGEPQTEPL